MVDQVWLDGLVTSAVYYSIVVKHENACEKALYQWLRFAGRNNIVYRSIREDYFRKCKDDWGARSKVFKEVVDAWQKKEVSKSLVRKVVRRFENNPEDIENVVMLSMLAQLTTVRVKEDAYKAALEKGRKYVYLLKGEPRLKESEYREYPETWVVVREPKIEIKRVRKNE